jgi:predicted transcriptional regulator
MKELTRAEEEIMQILWKIEKGFVKEIREHFPEPKPAYNTVSTIVRILQNKGFVDHEDVGKSHCYFPVISKQEYTKSFMKRMIKGYFSGSYKEMVSFFAKEENISAAELDEIRNMIEGNEENK